MKNLRPIKHLVSFFVMTSLLAACATTSNVDTSKLSLVKENHAEMVVNGKKYTLDSYLKPFQRPYYVSISSADKTPIEKSEAILLAREYIKPRGCTKPMSLRPDLDQFNSDRNKWLIGIEC